MIGWLTESMGRLFKTNPEWVSSGRVLEALDPTAVKEDRFKMTEAEMDAAFRAASDRTAASIAASLQMVREAVMDGRNHGLRELILDTELLKRINGEGKLGSLAAVKMSEGWDGESFPILMHNPGDHVADTVMSAFRSTLEAQLRRRRGHPRPQCVCRVRAAGAI